jgi:RNA polymerase sigma-70 factor (ECF subfamily)
MKEYDESQIVEMLSDPQRQRKAFAVVVSQYSESLYWKIRRMVLSHEDANDVLQNTFVKAWNSIATFQGKSKLSTWLYRIAINESLDFLRHQKLVQQVSADEMMGVSQKLLADEFFDGNSAEAILQEAISTLPDVQRMVFNLRYFDEMKYSDMSELLHTSEGALKSSYHIAVRKIKEYVDRVM